MQDVTEPPAHGFGTNIRRDLGGHMVGHLELYPSPALAGDVHEFDPLTGDGNGVRLRPVHGWIVQTTSRFGDLLGTGNRSASSVAWARILGQSTDALREVGSDKTSLNGGPPVFP